MIRQPVLRLFLGLGLAACAAGSFAQRAAPARLGAAQQEALKAAIAAPTRTPANIARDRYRHPYETLSFFGVRPSDTVVEIWPGGGWYTEILAPYLARRGTYYAVGMGPNGLNGTRRQMTANEALYGRIRTAAFPAWEATETRVADIKSALIMFERRLYHHIDWALLIAMLALCALGVVMIDSTTADPTRGILTFT